ncbi:hypothetical protein TGVAND_222948 [Toxoplasma gondii VAND]|uniref:Transmembrane protein n=1 Tax=Toxoplasma gondii VAND TaxID=933077 RepID=A0A086PT03_TOXGO|nr:hypothetical protein TGVAND_222948 [Toxoplasma gondii VAND]
MDFGALTSGALYLIVSILLLYVAAWEKSTLLCARKNLQWRTTVFGLPKVINSLQRWQCCFSRFTQHFRVRLRRHTWWKTIGKLRHWGSA